MSYIFEANAERERLQKAIIDMLEEVSLSDLRDIYQEVCEVSGF